MEGNQNIFKDQDYSAAINHAAACYYKIVLVVGRSGSGKTTLPMVYTHTVKSTTIKEAKSPLDL